mmetsp:Transcript_113276/g.315400  ORF Transcript_113276/g.315400 Transcript_113276/m.315400 type:complete len:330 (+) Transcript_113276:109-1098(+)
MTTKIPHPPLDCISRVRFAPQVGSSHLLVTSWDGHTRLYDAGTCQLIGQERHGLAVLDCSFLRDPARCVSAGLEKRVVCFDFQRQRETDLGLHDEAVRCVEFHPDTQQIFTGSWDRTLRAWDPRQPGQATSTVRLGAKVFAMDAAADRVVVGGSDRNIHMFDVRRMGVAMEQRESSLKHQVRVVKVGMDQRCYASASVEGRCAIEYFDPDENVRSRYAFKCHRVKDPAGGETVHPVNALAYHPQHGTFATGGSDGGVCVWDGYAKKRLWRLNPFHTSVSTLSFSADGTQLAIGVSYTFDLGEQVPPPQTELVIRKITDSEVLPKGLQKQ